MTLPPLPGIITPIVWLLALELIGLAALPLASYLFSAFPDRGYASSKFLGLLLVAYVSWATGILGITGFTGATVAVLTIALGVASWWRWGAQVREAWPSTRRLAITAEATFLVIFAIAVLIRSFNSPIAGQEKQMDLTFLRSLVQTDTLPAEDLWMSGHGMPYYYLGYLTQAVVAKATGTEPSIAYNLAVASVLALGALGAFGLTAGLLRLAGASYRFAIGLGVLGAFALTIMGNLEAMFRWISSQGFGDQAFWLAMGIKGLTGPGAAFPQDWSWFNAARVIPNIEPDGITEFPWFSFLLGDLHPHYMAIPLGILIVTLAAQQIADRSRSRYDAIRMAVTAVVLGAVILWNTWDIPVFWGIYALAVLAGVLREGGEPMGWRPRLQLLGTLLLITLILFAPYRVGYETQQLGLGINLGGATQRTLFGSLFVLFGPLLLLVFATGLLGVARWAVGSDDDLGKPPVRALAPVLGGVAAGLVLVLVQEPTLGFLVMSLTFWLALAWNRVRAGLAPRAITTALLAVVGLGSILLPELVFLRDVFGSRMNTVFKFYYDAWILLALAAPLMTWELIAMLRGTEMDVALEDEPAPLAVHDFDPQPVEAAPSPVLGRRPVPVWLQGLAGTTLILGLLFVVGGSIYPVVATQTRSDYFKGMQTLDGMIHLRNGRPDDAAAIDWLRRNYPETPVIEAVGNDYTDAARISTFAGTPTLMGWSGHEVQWRGDNPEIGRRQQLVDRVYRDADSAGWRPEVQRLGFQLVVVGSIEREKYGADVGSKFEGQFPAVHQSGSTVIYSLSPQAVAQR